MQIEGRSADSDASSKSIISGSLEAIAYLFQYDLPDEAQKQGIKLMPTRIMRSLSKRNVVIREFDEFSRYQGYFSRDNFTKETYESVLALEFVQFETGLNFEDSKLVQKLNNKLIGMNKDFCASYNEALVFFTKKTMVLGDFLDKNVSSFGVMVVKWAPLSGTSLTYVPISGSPWFGKNDPIKEEKTQVVIQEAPQNAERSVQYFATGNHFSGDQRNGANPQEVGGIRDLGSQLALESTEAFGYGQDYMEERYSKRIEDLEYKIARKKEKIADEEKFQAKENKNLQQDFNEERAKFQQIAQEVEQMKLTIKEVQSKAEKKRQETKNINYQNIKMHDLEIKYRDSLKKFKTDVELSIEEQILKTDTLRQNYSVLSERLENIKNHHPSLDAELDSLSKEKKRLLVARDQLKRELAYKRTHAGKAAPVSKQNKLEPLICFVCDKELVDMVYLPCRHMVSCSKCHENNINSLNRKDCVVCFKPLTETYNFKWE